jgi:hypothetical protein
MEPENEAARPIPAEAVPLFFKKDRRVDMGKD